MIHVIAIITAKAGQRENVLAAAKANIPAVLAEDGCIEYATAIDADGFGQAKFGPDTFVFIEKWRDLGALKAHAVAPHMKAYGAKVSDMIANKVVHVLAPTA